MATTATRTPIILNVNKRAMLALSNPSPMLAYSGNVCCVGGATCEACAWSCEPLLRSAVLTEAATEPRRTPTAAVIKATSETKTLRSLHHGSANCLPLLLLLLLPSSVMLGCCEVMVTFAAALVLCAHTGFG